VPRGGAVPAITPVTSIRSPTGAMMALASIQSQKDAGVKAVMAQVLPPSGLQPIVVCQQSPLFEMWTDKWLLPMHR
jgi:hypothetical protein